MIENLFSTRETPQDREDPRGSQVDPDRYFLILFLKASPVIYRTWIRKIDLESFKIRLYDSSDTLSPRKKFFQFGRHDELDLTEVAGYQTRPYLITNEVTEQ